MDLIVTAREAAEYLRCDKHTVNELLRTGRFRYARKVGGRWLLNLSREYPELFGDKGAADAGTSTATS